MDQKDKECVIYLINWPNNDYFYIGQSQDYHKRKISHLSKMNTNSHKNKKIQNVYNKYGIPEFHIIEECQIEELNEREQFYLNLLFKNNYCLNLSSTVDFMWRGKKLSKEHREAISKGNIGVPKSNEHKRKLSELKKGKKASDKTKSLMSSIRKGENHPNYNKGKPVIQYSIAGEFIKEWKSATQAFKIGNFRKAGISKCCKNQIKTSCGFIWRFKS